MKLCPAGEAKNGKAGPTHHPQSPGSPSQESAHGRRAVTAKHRHDHRRQSHHGAKPGSHGHWAIAFFEYCLQVPANRIGAGVFTLPQLKVIQEVLSLVVFALFYALYWKEKLSWNFMAAGFCLVGAVFFMFRDLKPL